MAERGTAGLSLRAIARNMGMTAPALYHYYGSMDDLITALIVDAFEGHAGYVRRARDMAAEDGASHTEQIYAAMLAYRRWALENTVSFQLIFGNPIPGYAAPEEVTVPAASKMGAVFMENVAAALQSGELDLSPRYHHVPPSVAAHYQAKYDMPDKLLPAFNMMNQMWSAMHGAVALEVYNHIGPVVDDTDAFYEDMVRGLMMSFGASFG
jgi:AcrR family transcriptional regulator